MELKKARKIAAAIRLYRHIHGSAGDDRGSAIILLDDRITELEAEVKRLEGQFLELNTLISDVY